jgi:hypothetical protein
VSKDVRIRGYISKPKGVSEQNSLGIIAIVGTVTRLGLDKRRIVLDYRQGQETFSPPRSVQTRFRGSTQPPSQFESRKSGRFVKLSLAFIYNKDKEVKPHLHPTIWLYWVH